MAGDPIPELRVMIVKPEGGKFVIESNVYAPDLFKGKKTVLVGFPGAFTQTCTEKHIPEYVQMMEEFKKKQVQLIGLAVNDAFVLKDFAEELKAQMVFIADGGAKFTKALAAGMDMSSHFLGYRTRRFSAIVVDNKLTEVNDEEGPKLTNVSKAETVLKAL